MTAFNLLKSVLYEGRTETQGTFFVPSNDVRDFYDALKAMFGSFSEDISTFYDFNLKGHWFYSYFDRVMAPVDDKFSPAYRAVEEDFSLTCRDGDRIYLYHID